MSSGAVAWRQPITAGITEGHAGKPWICLMSLTTGFEQKLRDMGYQDVRLIDTAQEAFGSHGRAAMMMLGSSRLLVGRK